MTTKPICFGRAVLEKMMNVNNYTRHNLYLSVSKQFVKIKSSFSRNTSKVQPLRPLRKWLNEIEIKESNLAHRLCKTIPAYCPFAREVQMFGRTFLRIPPLCKLNPLYEEVVALRFRALCYLADECGEDISVYC